MANVSKVQVVVEAKDRSAGALRGVSNNVIKLGQQLAVAELRMKELEKAGKDGTSTHLKTSFAIQNLKDKIAGMGDETVKADSSTKGLTGAFFKAQAAVALLTRGFDFLVSIGKKVVQTLMDIGRRVFDIIKWTVNSAGKMEQFAIAFETMLGSAEEAEKLLKKVSDFAIKTPFDLPQVVEGAKNLLAFGIEANDVIPALKMLGDVSAGVNVELWRVVQNYGQIKSRGRLTRLELKDFERAGIDLTQVLVDMGNKGLLAAGDIKTFGGGVEFTRATIAEMVSEGEIGFEDVTAAFERMTGEGGLFFDLMERQSKSFLGAIANLKDMIGIFAREMIGMQDDLTIREGSIFGLLRDGVVALMNKVEEARGKISEWVAVIDGLWAGFMTGVKAFWEKGGKVAFEAMIARVGEIFTGLQTLVASENAKKFMEQLGSDTAKFAVQLLGRLVNLLDALVTAITSGELNTGLNTFIKKVEILGKEVGAVVGFFRELIGLMDIFTGRGLGKEIGNWLFGPEGKLVQNDQFGGAVRGGQPYIVGERGPEMFVPNQPGRIEPNIGGGSAPVYNMNVHIGMYAGDAVTKRRIAEELMDEYRYLARSKGRTVWEEIQEGGQI